MAEARGLTRIALRNIVLYVCLALFCVSLVGVWFAWPWGVGVLVFGALTGLGLFDLAQKRRTVSRNYPILAHFRYFLESIGPEIRQYFIQSDLDERPFSREQRAMVYQRSKNEGDKKPFGSLLQMYHSGHEWINHSVLPSKGEESARSGRRRVRNPTTPAC